MVDDLKDCVYMYMCMYMLLPTCPPDSRLIRACSSGLRWEELALLSPLPALDIPDEEGFAVVFTCK